MGEMQHSPDDNAVTVKNVVKCVTWIHMNSFHQNSYALDVAAYS